MSNRDVLLNDFERQWADVSDAVLAAVATVGQSGWYILGQEVEQFEKALGAFTGRREVVGCASGLDAIEIALRALELTPGTKVLTTPLSAFATTLGIVRAGGVPVFVDVDDSGLIHLQRCRDALGADSTIRAMVPVHLFGHTVALEELQDIRQRFDVLVVEDCAQSIGAAWRGRPSGTVGQLSATSFYPTKNLGALGDGGAIAADDGALAVRCRALRDYGQTAKYVHDELGLNSRLDELHAAILRRALLPKLPGWNERRRLAARAYVERIDHPLVRCMPAPPGSESVWHLFPVRVPADRRGAFMRHLQSRGVRTAIHYPRLIPSQKALAGRPFEIRDPLARAREIAATEVSLPIHPYLQDAEVDRVVEAVNSWSGE
jgi:dTDP-3-amino-3,4,6-trideoxy-alpha-D-glucose transaminase